MLLHADDDVGFIRRREAKQSTRTGAGSQFISILDARVYLHSGSRVLILICEI